MTSRNSNVGKLFDFNINGYGVVTHEVRLDYKTWSPVIHILKFTDDAHKDKITLRFGYCDNTGKLISRPLYLTESELTELGKEAAKDPEIKKISKASVTKSGNLQYPIDLTILYPRCLGT